MALPDVIYLVEEHRNDGSKWLAASRTAAEAIEDSGMSEPILVGRYKLQDKQKLRLQKTVKPVK